MQHAAKGRRVEFNSMDGAIYTRTGLDYYWRYCKVSLVMVAEGPK